MKLVNNTPFPALLEMGSTTDNEQLGTVVCKVSYQWFDGGDLFPLPSESMWPVNRAPAMFQGVMLLPDADFRREGIDVLVFGDAVAPEGKPVTGLQVGVASGSFLRHVDVLGDRRWQRVGEGEGAGWQASAPQPFTRMPLGTERAYGGKASLQGSDPQPFSMNPQGKGYALDEAQVEGLALPNLERPAQRISRWTDQPVPACFHKPQGGLLLAAEGPDSWRDAAGAADPLRLPQVLMQQSFQQAPPDFICPRGALGPRLSLAGFDASGVQHMALPPEVASPQQGPCAYVEVGKLRAVLPLRIGSMVVLTLHRMLVLTFVASFRYLVRPGETRQAVLEWHGATDFALGGRP